MANLMEKAPGQIENLTEIQHQEIHQQTHLRLEGIVKVIYSILWKIESLK